MTKDNQTVHCVWVGSDLSLLEQLTVKLLQSHGHIVNLWTYGDVTGIPDGVVVSDASQILPESSMFRYNGLPVDCLPNGGKGSLSHWSDQFQLKLLDELGGVYTQMDVAYLKPISFERAYAMPVWVGKLTSVAPYVMKCPRKGKFTSRAYEKTSRLLHSDTVWDGIKWGSSMEIMGKTLLEVAHEDSQPIEDYMVDLSTVWDLGCKAYGPFFENLGIPADVSVIHWSNATVNKHKNNPIPDSTYFQLLKKVALI